MGWTGLGWAGQLDEPNAMSALDVAWMEEGGKGGTERVEGGEERRGGKTRREGGSLCGRHAGREGREGALEGHQRMLTHVP